MTRMSFLMLAAGLVVGGCGAGATPSHDAGPSGADAGLSDGGPPDAGTPDSGLPDGGGPDGGSMDGGTSCPAGIICVDQFPFHDDNDTSLAPPGTLEGYSCAPVTDESGPEVIYRVSLPHSGFLSAAVYDDAGVDVDVHLLTSLDAATCLDRGDHHARADVAQGYAYVVVDSYVSGGVTHSGPYSVDIGFLVPSEGACDMEVGQMPRVGDNGNTLAMPATGPIVMEAHLVTQAEPAPYPMTATENLARHYALSQAATGLVMYRTQVWAPLEGGSFYGAGIWPASMVPVSDEGWYVNMYWTAAARPARGTRMILRDPNGGPRAVVVSAGYETGPGDLAHVAGTPEETHFYQGTNHLDPMTVGIAVDQSLPLGPRICTSP